MKPKIFNTLAAVAPNVVFDYSRKVDESFRWDGDGPDPELEGFQAYDVTVSARTIANGKMMLGEAYLGGSYFKPDEELDDIHGYLLQMLEEAYDDLIKCDPDDHLIIQVENAKYQIRATMKREYNAQRKAFR